MKLKNQSNELRAGLFVVAGIAVFTLVIFLLGRKSALFTPTTTLYVQLADVNGLVVGSPVRLAGLEIGTVSSVSFPGDLRKKEARVRLTVRSSFMERIRANSEAVIDSNGLLGDKIINVSLGDPKSPMLAEGATIKTGETRTFEALAESLHGAINSAKFVTDEARLFMQGVREHDIQGDLARITASTANVLAEIENGRGLAHRLVYDRRDAEELATTLSEARGITEKANRAMGRVDTVLAEVERGDGTLHALVYGEEGKQTLTDLALAAREIAEVAHEIRAGQGLAHNLIYEADRSRFLSELDELTATLNRMVKEIDQGRGTLGGLIKDPTIYEDLKTTLGNIERNVLFKALVRFTIEKNDLRRAEEAPKVQPAAP